MPTYLKALTRHSEVLLERLHLFFKCQSEGDVPWGGGCQYTYVFSINKGLIPPQRRRKHHEMTIPHDEHVQ